MTWYCSYGVANCPECRRPSAPLRAVAVAKPVTMTEGATVLAVPFAQKDQAKALGAKWNPERKVWFVPAGRPTSPFKRWFPATTEATAPVAAAAIEAQKNGASYDELMEALTFASTQAPAPAMTKAPVPAEVERLFEKVELKAARR